MNNTELIEAIERNTDALLIAATEVLPIKLAALYCGVSINHLRAVTSKGELNRAKHEKLVFYRKSDLDRWKLGHPPNPA